MKPNAKAKSAEKRQREPAPQAEQAAAAQSLAAAMPYNTAKAGEEVMDFISNQFRHGKTLLAIGASKSLLERAGASTLLANGELDPGIVIGTAPKTEHAAADFIAALGRHRHPEREAGALAP